MAVAGEQPADARLRERIDFTSNILFFIEDLYLAVGQGAITTKSGTKLDVFLSPLGEEPAGWERQRANDSEKSRLESASESEESGNC